MSSSTVKEIILSGLPASITTLYCSPSPFTLTKISSFEEFLAGGKITKFLKGNLTRRKLKKDLVKNIHYTCQDTERLVLSYL